MGCATSGCASATVWICASRSAAPGGDASARVDRARPPRAALPPAAGWRSTNRTPPSHSSVRDRRTRRGRRRRRPAFPGAPPRAPSPAAPRTAPRRASRLRLKTKTFGQSTTLAVTAGASEVSPLAAYWAMSNSTPSSSPLPATSVHSKPRLTGVAAERLDRVGLGRRVEDAHPGAFPVARLQERRLDAERAAQRPDRHGQPDHLGPVELREQRLARRPGNQLRFCLVVHDRHRGLDGLQAGDARGGKGPRRGPPAVDLAGGDRLDQLRLGDATPSP